MLKSYNNNNNNKATWKGRALTMTSRPLSVITTRAVTVTCVMEDIIESINLYSVTARAHACVQCFDDMLT